MTITSLLVEELIAAMAYSRNDHFLILRLNGVDDPIVTHSNSEQDKLLTLQFFQA